MKLTEYCGRCADEAEDLYLNEGAFLGLNGTESVVLNESGTRRYDTVITETV